MKKKKNDSQRLVSIVIIVAILAVGAWLIWGNNDDTELAPRSVCNLGDLDTCVTGCWTRYEERIEDIDDTEVTQDKKCCKDSKSCSWSIFSGCIASDPPQFACSTGEYRDCKAELDDNALRASAVEDRKACITICQDKHCQTGKVARSA